jgi:hypothetical protein
MNHSNLKSPRRWWDADLCSPKDFVRHAVLIVIVFAVAHLCGLREHTSFLNGTGGATGMDYQTSAMLGVAYVLLYLACVLLVPTMLLAALLLFVWQKWFPQRTRGE